MNRQRKNKVLNDLKSYNCLPTNKSADRRSRKSADTLNHYVPLYLNHCEEVTLTTFTQWLSSLDMVPASRSSIMYQLGKFLSIYGYLPDKDFKAIKTIFGYKGSMAWSRQMISDNAIGDSIRLYRRLYETESDYNHYIRLVVSMLMILLGPRPQQVVELTTYDVIEMDKAWHIHLNFKKKHKNESLLNYDIKPIPKETWFYFDTVHNILTRFIEWREELGAKDKSFFINARTGRGISLSYVFRTIRKVFNGLDVNPRTFRHRAITRTAEKHGVLKASILAGHSRLATTQRYIAPEGIDISDVVGGLA